MTKAYLDHASFPHLIDLIIYNSPISVLKAFRLTSRYYADRIDTWLAHHIILHSTPRSYSIHRIRRSTYEGVLEAYLPNTKERLCIRLDRHVGDTSRPWNDIDLFRHVKILDVGFYSGFPIQLYTYHPALEVIRISREDQGLPPSARTIVVHGPFRSMISWYPSMFLSLKWTDRLIVHAAYRLPPDRDIMGDFCLRNISWSPKPKGLKELVLIGNGRCECLSRVVEDIFRLLCSQVYTPIRGITFVDFGKEEKCFLDLLDSISPRSWDIIWKFLTREQYAKTLTDEEVEVFLGESLSADRTTVISSRKRSTQSYSIM